MGELSEVRQLRWSVSSFFRASERNVRQFYGGWFWQVLGWNPAGVLPFRNHALQSSMGAVSELCSREFFLADEVATSRESTSGNGIIASSFFRASERNVTHLDVTHLSGSF